MILWTLLILIFVPDMQSDLPSTYLFPIFSLSFFKASSKSSSVSNSIYASPEGLPSRVTVKWTDSPEIQFRCNQMIFHTRLLYKFNEVFQISYFYIKVPSLNWQLLKKFLISSTVVDHGKPRHLATKCPSSFASIWSWLVSVLSPSDIS